MTIYERIRMLRELAGLSQTELAKRCGYSEKSMISRIEAGRIDLPLSKLEAIAKALGVNPAYLAGYDPEQRPRDLALELNDLIEKASQLDPEDRARIAERIDTLLEAEKYT